MFSDWCLALVSVLIIIQATSDDPFTGCGVARCVQYREVGECRRMLAFKGRVSMRQYMPKSRVNGVWRSGCWLARTVAMRISGCCIPEKKTTVQLSDLGGVLLSPWQSVYRLATVFIMTISSPAWNWHWHWQTRDSVRVGLWERIDVAHKFSCSSLWRLRKLPCNAVHHYFYGVID